MLTLRYKRRISIPLRGVATALLMICFFAGTTEARKPEAPRRDRECCDLEGVKGLVWTGADPVMTFAELAAYCAPILWFSPDEPLLERERGKAIRLTQALPFEEPADAPVVYYKIDDVASRVDKDGPAFTIDSSSRGESTIDLRQVNAFDLRFCLYYPFDVGVGGHIHDLEVVDMKVVVYRWDDWMDNPCDECQYVVSIQKVIGRAHGLQWYDNHLDIDVWAEFPIGVLIEEGKHANCPDKNLDGIFTPNYDVNERVNDAWGIRDIIRGGELFTGGFESWMNKVRRDQDRVFPPLPEDSRLRQYHSDASGEYAPDNAIYELRPLPAAELALPDERLAHYIESKGDPDWPDEFADTDIRKLSGWLADESFSKSLSIAFRYDGEAGFSFAFPFFIIKHLEAPMIGGWIVQRMYLQSPGLKQFGWTALYAPSASRWKDTYLSAGAQFNTEDVSDGMGGTRSVTTTDFVMETGLKFRVNMKYSPMKFLAKLTDFWGFRLGIKYQGNVWDLRNLGLVMEVGAGTF